MRVRGNRCLGCGRGVIKGKGTGVVVVRAARAFIVELFLSVSVLILHEKGVERHF